MTPPLQTYNSPDQNFPIKTPGKIEGKMKFLSRKNAGLIIGGVALLGAMCLTSGTAAAQDTPPTPLPQVVATQQAANAAGQQVNDLQAQRAQTEAKLAEINRNIEAQIAAAAQAAADARNAAATQNAVEAGAAIGRLEGAIAQLRDSYAGKDAIIADLQTRNEQQDAQIVTDKRMIDTLTLQLQQAQRDKQTTLNAYNAVTAQQATNQQNDMVSNAVWLIVALAFLLAVILIGAFVISRRREGVTITTATAEIIEPPIDEDRDEDDSAKMASQERENSVQK